MTVTAKERCHGARRSWAELFRVSSPRQLSSACSVCKIWKELGIRGIPVGTEREVLDHHPCERFKPKNVTENSD
jgi:hypothetical protein